MKNLINKVRDHGKKITIHLKRHHKKYLFGAFCCGVLAFLCVHMAGSVKNIFAGGPTVLVRPPQKTEIVLSGAAVLRYENFDSLCSTGLSTDGGVDISCTGQGIEAVAFGAFSGYTNIHTLDLSNNKISSMDFYHEYGNNYGKISVTNLNLSHNNISEVKTNFPASYVLVLSENRQQFTFAEALKNTNVWSVINIELAGTIYLDNNKISSIDDRAFSGLRLSGLYLQNNVLSNVTAQMFEGIISLKKLDLGWNYIIELNKGVLAIPRLEYLLIDGNCLSEDEVSDLSDNSYRSLAICGIKDGETLECEDLTVDGQKACFNVEYDVYTPTSGEVNATLTLTGQGSFFGDYSDRTGFTVNGTKYFDVSRFELYARDIANEDSTRLFPATVTWIKPTCSVEYSTTNPTNSGVIAYLTGCSESLEVTNNSGANNSGKDYLFTGNGSFTFQFKDDYGNTGSTTATVDWIDKVKPTCNVAYDVTGATTGNVVASLTGCSETITGTNSQYTFTRNGTYTFNFQDLASNTGSTGAEVTWIYHSGVQITGATQLINMYNEENALTCNVSYSGDDTLGTNIIYIKDEMISQEGWITYTGGEKITMYSLARNGKMYAWGNLYGTGIGMYISYDLDIDEELESLGEIEDDTILICSIGVESGSMFDLPNNITFYEWNHYAANGVSFSISIDDTIKAGENTDFLVKVMKDGATFKNYTGTVYFELADKNGSTISRDLYEFSDGRHYKFDESDRGRKTFSIKIKKVGTYILKLYDSDNEYIEGSEIITVKSNGSSSSAFEYDYLKFNPNYSNEMNEAYQYARYYNITTTDNIKQADMTGGLNRVAMAKMLANYAVNVLGKDDFDKSRNCTFKDVSSSLDKSYDYGITKACQLGIMGVNMPDGKFYPKEGVTRAEFATALSRLLYGTKDGTDKYYSTHIAKLYGQGIISNTDPKLQEKRGYVMIMLKRVAEN